MLAFSSSLAESSGDESEGHPPSPAPPRHADISRADGSLLREGGVPSKLEGRRRHREGPMLEWRHATGRDRASMIYYEQRTLLCSVDHPQTGSRRKTA